MLDKRKKKFTLRIAYKSVVTKIKQSDDGVAAIEFALLAPLFIGLYFGLAETATGIAKDRAVSHATNVVGDLASQVSNIDKSDIEDMFSATLRIIGTSTGDNVTIQLDSYSRDSDNKDTLVGSAVLNSGSATLQQFVVKDVDDTLLNENAGILVARVAYDYEPLKLKYMKSNITLRDSFVLKPRRSAEITFANTPGKTFTCNSKGLEITCN